MKEGRGEGKRKKESMERSGENEEVIRKKKGSVQEAESSV